MTGDCLESRGHDAKSGGREQCVGWLLVEDVKESLLDVSGAGDTRLIADVSRCADQYVLLDHGVMCLIYSTAKQPSATCSRGEYTVVRCVYASVCVVCCT